MFSPSDGIGAEELSDRLDRMYCYHLTMVQWSISTAGRLTVSTRRLLQTDLERDSRSHLEAARQLAERVIQLGGRVTADPSDLVYRAPTDSFDGPDNPADEDAVLTHLQTLITSAIDAYEALLDVMGPTDPVSQGIIEDLLAAATARRADVRAAAARPTFEPVMRPDASQA